MGQALGAALGYAVGIAISPIPIAAVILMLFSARARTNSVVFLIGWVVGVALVVTVAQFLPVLDSDRGEPTSTTGWVKLALGVLLLLAGVRQWRSRPSGEQAHSVPAWMQRIDELRPGPALAMGFLLSAVNPKNLLLAMAAGATIATADVSGAEATLTVAVFAFLAASTVIVPVIGYLVAGPPVASSLTELKDWLVGNNAAVMSVLFLVFGASLLGDAMQILTR